MDRLNEILRQLGISKVKLAKLLGVSRQMIYNYLELEDINKWPKDKKVMLLNLLGIKSPEELNDIKVDTDYIMRVEARIDNLFSDNIQEDTEAKNLTKSAMFDGLAKKQKEVMYNIIEVMREKLDDEHDEETYQIFLYLYHYIQSINTNPELKYILAYTSKAVGFTQPDKFVFDRENQFDFESILFSAITLYKSGGYSKKRISEAHHKFVEQIEYRKEEALSRTVELTSAKEQALKELGYNEITEENAAEVFNKIGEIHARKVTD